MLKIVIAVLLFLAILRVGLFVLRAVSRGAPAPPPPGEMRRVDLHYRCTVCGAEVRMTRAIDEEPDPPRHCQEDMELLTPVD
ncbi:MAG TPA: hypothetical protein VKI64_02365 [Acidimicrobiales bacterium]|nr:hypothetical protein [Acidimicrobiales bacterium]